MGALKPQSNRHCSHAVIGTLAVDRWAVTFGTAWRGQGGGATRPGPSSMYQMLLPPINGQCTNHCMAAVSVALPIKGLTNDEQQLIIYFVTSINAGTK